MENLEIPAGHTHQSVLIERGWSRVQIADHLQGFMVKIDAPEGTSNKCYADTEIARVEKEDTEIKKAIQAKKDRIDPTLDSYDYENTISRTTLIQRGWTPAHIARLLGTPDATYADSYRGESYRYGIDRVEHAETHDTKLRKRLATVEAKRQAEISAATDGGDIIFRKLDGEWVIEGYDLTSGETVTVTKKSGEKVERIVDQIISDDDGKRVATFRLVPKACPVQAPVEEIKELPVEATTVETPKAPQSAQKITTHDDLPTGTAFNRYGKWIVATYVSGHTAKMWEEEQRGFIAGDWVNEYTYRAATEDEISEVKADSETAAAKSRATRDLIDEIKNTGVLPQAESPEGEIILDSFNIYGSGERIIISESTAWYLLNNGMDGDDWSRNNVATGGAGAIGWKAPVTPKIQALVQEM